VGEERIDGELNTLRIDQSEAYEGSARALQLETDLGHVPPKSCRRDLGL